MNFGIERDESFKDYKIRLSKNKDIYGLSWEQIAKLLNTVSGNNFNESTYRKWWKAYCEGQDDASGGGILDLDEIEMQKSKIKFYDQRREYNRLIRQSARDENLREIFVNELRNVKPIEYHPDYAAKTYCGNDLFVGLSDIHYGINIQNYWNEYNPEIAKKRIIKYLEKIVEIQQTHGSESCYVCSNGDLISGKIHNTIEIANCENVVSQVMGVSELISFFLTKLCEEFKNVYFCVVAGNHSRIGKKDEVPYNERLDDLIPWYVKSRLQNVSNFSILDNTIDPTMNMVTIRGLNYVNVHGDYDNASTIQKLTDMIDDKVYCVCLAHKHHNSTDYTHKYKVIMTGSLMGVDDFCVQKRIYGKAQQLVGVCTDKGMICTYDVDLQ